MDQVKIGKFIAELRRKEGLTQQALGERIGISNKTVSRWENGNYMPDIEMLPVLAAEFHVSVNELLAGQILDEADFRSVADENVLQIVKACSFSMDEKKKFFVRKWRREHIALLVLFAAVPLALFALAIILQKPLLAGLAPLAALGGYAYQNNAMMIYVEKSVYRD